MDTSEVNIESAEKGKDKFPWQGLLLIIAVISIVGGLIYYQSCSTKNSIEKYAREQLLSRNYSIVELTLVESHSSSKLEDEGGKVTFVVKDQHGLTLEGKADIVTERHWVFVMKKAFKLTSIKPKK